MYLLRVSCFFLFIGHLYPNHVNSSDFGTSGLIDVPTARMSGDGILRTTAAIQSRTNSYAITYQATPWLEGTFRYTGFNYFFYYDRNYETKIRLWQEQEYIPQLAIGIRDLVGTGIFGSEYIVASKEMGNFDVTVGIGWGRLSGKGNFTNPLTLLSSRFEIREEAQGGMGDTGVFQLGEWFSGESVGIFGGFEYDFESMPLSFILEYNPDQYDWGINVGGYRPKSPFSGALKWDASRNIAVTISRQHDQEWGIALSAGLDTKSLPKRSSRRIFQSSLDIMPSDLPDNINPKFWYDTLLFDAERSGILLLEATIDDAKNSVTIVMGNLSYPVWMDAIDVMASLADLHLPITVSSFNILIEEEGHRVNSVQLRRPSLDYNKSRLLVEREITINPVKPLKFVQHRTNFFQKKIVFDVNLGNRVQLFDPDDPLRYQLYAKIGLSMMLPHNLVLRGAIDRNITNNFDQSTRQSNSSITRVRSDIVKYLNEGDSGIDFLFVQKRGNLKSDIFYRVFGGILESMYSGVGGEVLYQPFQSRLAFGLSANWVRQRDYRKNFRHLDYQTATAFASAYWATPFYNFDVAFHAGKYLAKDVGATLEVRRTFGNGWMIGLWATKTNVSAEDFGEGSFDKGLFFKIPLNGFLKSGSRNSYTSRIRPIQRDGGQYLEDYSGNIWWDIRGARFDALSDSTDRLSL